MSEYDAYKSKVSKKEWEQFMESKNLSFQDFIAELFSVSLSLAVYQQNKMPESHRQRNQKLVVQGDHELVLRKTK